MGDEVSPAPLSSRLGSMVPLGVGAALFWLLIDQTSKLSCPPFVDIEIALWFDPPPTAPRNRLYKPLSPFCMRSPANPLLSVFVDDEGGEPNSLKVVKVSDWHAVLCILSSACASCSLSIGVDPESEASEPRRERRPSCTSDEAIGESVPDILDEINKLLV